MSYSVAKNESGYPVGLLRLENPPEKLYFKKYLPSTDAPTVAIVGERICSVYGRYVAKGISTSLANKGINIISTFSNGVNGIALKAAEGMSYAVMSGGCDVINPVELGDLYDAISYGIVSPFPDGTKPSYSNAIISKRVLVGLSDAVIVVEARAHSGTLMFADFAKEIGIPVYALPGRTTDRLSDGCNLLLKEGAELLLNVDDAADEILTRLDARRK